MAPKLQAAPLIGGLSDSINCKCGADTIPDPGVVARFSRGKPFPRRSERIKRLRCKREEGWEAIWLRKGEMSDQVKDHYDNRPTTHRKLSDNAACKESRNWNNFVKASMIETYGKRGASVLDVCCGSGGDLKKYEMQCVNSYVGVDLSAGCISRAIERTNSMNLSFSFKFVTGDVNMLLLSEFGSFDLVSCQMGPQFFFESAESLGAFAANVAGATIPGGFFIGSMPDADALLQKSVSSDSGSFGNALYTVKTDTKLVNDLGQLYRFTLSGCVEDCPEFLAPWNLMRAALDKEGFELVECARFNDFQRRHPPLQKRMHSEYPKLEADREVCELYIAFAFKRS